MSDPNPHTIQHVVQPGETLFGIAEQNGVTPGAILAANPQIPNPNKIFPGQIVFIPRTDPGGEPDDTVEVQPTTDAPPEAGMVLSGLDASVRLTDQAACIKSKGFSFAVRYYTRGERKRTLTLTEARALVQAGLRLGVVFEDGFPTEKDLQPGFFTHQQGVGDGRAAHDRATNKIGQPANTPIYFGVDFDASPQNLAAGITRYFEGVREAFLEANNGTLKYQIGVYGSGLTCTELLKNGHATFAWLSQSTGHRGSKDFAKRKLYNLIQFLDKDVCTINVDPDETNPDPVKFPPGLFTV